MIKSIQHFQTEGVKKLEDIFVLKIAKFNSTIHLYGGILFCTSGI